MNLASSRISGGMRQASGASCQAPPNASGVGTSAEAFQIALAKAKSKGHEELKEAATKLVSSALVLPALGNMHGSPLRPTKGPFAENSVEKRFGPLLDQQFADRVAKSSNFGLIENIVERYGRTSAVQQSQEVK